MGSLRRKDLFCLTLCLITLFSLTSCASTADRSVAEESAVKRAPPADEARFTPNKIVNRQFVQGRN